MQKQNAIGLNPVPQEPDSPVYGHFKSARRFVVCDTHFYLILVGSAGLQAATALSDLAGIPGNRLEALSGKRRGQHSIRVNDQYRICFVWKDGAAWDVEIVDYH